MNEHVQSQPPQAQKKKGLPVIAWVGIGCGAMVLIAGVVFVIGSMFVFNKAKDFVEDPHKLVRFMIDKNPDIDLVEYDEDSGKITVRVKETGEEYTLDFDDVKQGRISLKKGDESVTFQAQGEGDNGGLTITGTGKKDGDFEMHFGQGESENVPSWVPRYPGAEAAGQFSMQASAGGRGSLALKTDDPVDQVMEHYSRLLKDEGYETNVTTYSADDATKGGIVTGVDKASGRNLQIIISRENDEPTSISITYSEEQE